MTIRFGIEAIIVLLILPIGLAYIAARIDLYFIHKRIKRKHERERIMSILKR